MTVEKVAILDAGSQYGKVIDRRIRELSVYSELLPINTPVEKLVNENYKAIIISGSPDSVNQSSSAACDIKLFDVQIPILGICYGMQYMNKYFDGDVMDGLVREDGQFAVDLDTTCSLFKGLSKQENVLLTHGDFCVVAGKGFKVVATSGSNIAAIANEEKKLYGLQFHPEVDLTPCGVKVFKNFLFGVCELKGDYKLTDRIEECKAKIQKIVGQKKIMILLSGGVDSTVCAVLLFASLKPSQILALHIDNGFMRKNESSMVAKSLINLGIKVHVINGALRFLSGTTIFPIEVQTELLAPVYVSPPKSNDDAPLDEAADVGGKLQSKSPDCMIDESTKTSSDLLGTVKKSSRTSSGGGGSVNSYVECRNIPIGPLGSTTINPEEKRHIIGDIFVRIAQEAWSEFSLDSTNFLLCQGTLRPDLIESACQSVSQNADVIKTHHNTTNLVKILKSQDRVLEPLVDFHKDEVREIGKRLGVPEEILHRHPFPGPGLSIRILCAAESFMERDFSETTSLIKMIAGYHQMSQKPHALLNKINAAAQLSEQQRLSTITADRSLSAYLLPIRSVGVQGDHRTYSYVCALSSNRPPNWASLSFLASLIPRICHNINRVVYILGPQVMHPVNDITVTYLRQPVINTLRDVDDAVMSVLRNASLLTKVSQVPVILIPIHFDRDPSQVVSVPSMLRSVVIRPVITSDYMTAIAAVPGVHIPEKVVFEMQAAAEQVPGVSRVLYDLTSKPPGTIEWE